MPPGGYVDDVGVGGGAGSGLIVRGEETGLRTPPGGGGGGGVDGVDVAMGGMGDGVVNGFRGATPNVAVTVNGNGNGNTDATANSNAATTTTTALPEQWHSYLNPHTEIPWVPWPTDDIIRRGGLASLQQLVDTGADIQTQSQAPDTAGMESLQISPDVDRSREVEAQLQKEKADKEEMVRREVERARHVAADAGALQQQQQQQQQRQAQSRQPRVFEGLSALDDDDED